MYSITALFCAKGRGATNATAVTLELARDKARKLKSQGFYVEIRDEDGGLVPSRVN